MIPDLEHYCGSWIVTHKISGEVVGEFFNRDTVARINQDKYLIETTAQYLKRLNDHLREIRR